MLLAGVGVFALGWIVAQYAKRIHAAGSLYDYVTNGSARRSVPRRAGSTTPARSSSRPVSGLLIGGYVHDNLMPGVFSVDGGLMPIWAWQVLFALGLFAVLYFGVQISTRVQLTLALISVAVVLVYFLSVIVRLGGDNDFGKAFNPNPSPDGFTGIMFGVLYGVLIFVGFETAANLAEETAEPKKSIPRAVLLSVVVVSLFYLIAAYARGGGVRLRHGRHHARLSPCAVVRARRAGRGVRIRLHPRSPPDRRVPRIWRCAWEQAPPRPEACSRWLATAACLPRPRGCLRNTARPTSAIVLLIVVQVRFIARSECWDGLFAFPGLPTTSRSSSGGRRSAGSPSSSSTC